MSKVDKERLKIMSNISKNVQNKEWNCLFKGCQDNAINSHLLQRNGILNNLIEDGHLIEIKANDFFEIEKKGGFKI
jgi:hypothetical protein